MILQWAIHLFTICKRLSEDGGIMLLLTMVGCSSQNFFLITFFRVNERNLVSIPHIPLVDIQVQIAQTTKSGNKS